MSIPHRPFGTALALVAALYAAAAFLIPVHAIDALFLPDDTYYTLTIARNIAAGLGPTTDGVIQTTGFQPLIAMLLQPVFWLGLEGDMALRAAIALSAMAAVAAMGIAGAIARDATGSVWAGALTVLVCAASTRVLGNSLNGLETSLAALFGLLLVRMGMATPPDAPVGRLVAVGCVAGLALWARIDAALIILTLLPVALWRLGLARTGIVALVAAATVSPWVIYCLIETGRPLPESGSAVRQIVGHYADIGRQPLDNVKAAGLALGAGVLPGLPAAWESLVVIFFAGPLVLAARAGRMDAPAMLAVASILMIAFYVFYLPAFWFFSRYFFFATLSLMVAIVVTLWPYLAARIGRVGLIVPLLYLGVHAPDFASYVQVWRGQSDMHRIGHHYGAAARDLLAEVPQGAVLTAMQSGALSWFAPEDLRVVNLDGVVNGDAKAALHDGTMDRYLDTLGATHFADWEVNRVWLQARSEEPVALSHVAVSADHMGVGQDFVLYQILRD